MPEVRASVEADTGNAPRLVCTALKNPFYREPNHIRTASQLGLGTWDLEKIDRSPFYLLPSPLTGGVGRQPR